MDARPIVSAVASAACALAWAYVGARLLRRPLLPEHAAAGRAFGLAWIGASVFAGLNGIISILAIASVDTPALLLALAWTSVVAGCGLVAGLVAYVTHLLTGDRRAVPLVLGAYAILALVVISILLALGPHAATTTGWTARFVFDRAPDSANGLIALLILAPGAAVSVCYLSALHGARSNTARWRILLVGGGMSLWTFVAILVRIPGAPTTLLGLPRIAGAIAALATFLAYMPPTWAARRFHIESLGDEIARVARIDPAAKAREAALARRVVDLI